MGSVDPGAYAADREGPVRTIALSPYAIAPTTVTVAEFAAFVAATGYRTSAVAEAPWWREVPGADWAHPEGP